MIGNDFIIGVIFGMFLNAIIAAFAICSAYRNGVVDGYGYAREPKNPGYRKAGEHLKKTMKHRWYELEDYNG